jgi:hypothetical protein
MLGSKMICPINIAIFSCIKPHFMYLSISKDDCIWKSKFEFHRIQLPNVHFCTSFFKLVFSQLNIIWRPCQKLEEIDKRFYILIILRYLPVLVKANLVNFLFLFFTHLFSSHCLQFCRCFDMT